MADCFTLVNGSLVQVSNPADLSTCQNVVLSGADYGLFLNAVNASSVPYDFVQGGLIFAALFVPTVSLYLFTRSASEILRIIRRNVGR